MEIEAEVADYFKSHYSTLIESGKSHEDALAEIVQDAYKHGRSDERSNGTTYREILFRGRSIETGEYVTGNYHHNCRKGTYHTIAPKDSNIHEQIYRESLEMMGWGGEWEAV